MAVSLLGRLAASAPVPVFLVAGRGTRDGVARLRVDERLELADSPRHATVLLVAGEVPARHAPALRRIHDQLPHPRAAVWWTGEQLGPSARETLPDAMAIDHEVAATLVSLHEALVSGKRRSAPPVGPDQNPTEWQGIGPHGQGGEGMMAGTPYGRSMAMTGEDIRDGLQLDRVPLTLGPYHAALPPGLALDLEVQGDVIVSCDVRGPGQDVIGAPLPRQVPTADPQLLWVADVLRVHGLHAHATQLLRVAVDGRDGGPLVAKARRRLYWSLAGVGEIGGADALERFDRIAGGEEVPYRADPASALAESLPGMEWSAAVTTIWTLASTALERDAGAAT